MSELSCEAKARSGPEWWYKEDSVYAYSRRLTYPPTLRRVAPVEWEDHSEKYRRMVEFVPELWKRWHDGRASVRDIGAFWRSSGPVRLSFSLIRYFLLFHGHWRGQSHRSSGILDRTRRMLEFLSSGYSMAESGSEVGFSGGTVSSWLYLLGFRKREKRDIYKSILADGGILTFRELLKKLRVSGEMVQELSREFGLRDLFRGRRRELLDRLDGESEVDGLPCWLLRHPRAAEAMILLLDCPKTLRGLTSVPGVGLPLYMKLKGSVLLKRMISFGWLSRYRGDRSEPYYYTLTPKGYEIAQKMFSMMGGNG